MPPPRALPPRQAGPGLQHRSSRRTPFTAREPGEWTTRRESPAPVSNPGVLLLTDCEAKPTWEGNTIGNWNSQAILVHPNLQTLQWLFLFMSVCGVPNQTECLDTSLSQPVGVRVASHLVVETRLAAEQPTAAGRPPLQRTVRPQMPIVLSMRNPDSVVTSFWTCANPWDIEINWS